jgi:hypothetical protein
MPSAPEGAAQLYSELKPKPNGRIATLEAKVAELESKVDTIAWLHAELMQKLKMMLAQQLLANPDVQERIKQAIASQLGG